MTRPHPPDRLDALRRPRPVHDARPRPDLHRRLGIPLVATRRRVERPSCTTPGVRSRCARRSRCDWTADERGAGRRSTEPRIPTGPTGSTSRSSSRSSTRRSTWRRACAASTRSSTTTSRSGRSSRSPTTRAPTAPGRWRRRWPSELARVRAVHLDAKGRGRALQHVWATSTAKVVAYMDVDLSTDLNALLPLGGSAAVRAQRPRDRQPALAFGARGARTETRTDLARLQPDAAHDVACPLQRRAVRFQGDAQRLRPRAAAARARHVLVLRHRVARARRTQRAAHRGDPGRLGRRPRQPRRPGRHRARRPARCRADGRLAAAGPVCRYGNCARNWVTTRPHRIRSSRQAIRFGAVGIASTLAYLALFLLWRAPLGAQVANLLALLVTALLTPPSTAGSPSVSPAKVHCGISCKD